jgi:hypothetical protein
VTEEHYFGFRGKFANLSSDLDAIYCRKPDVNNLNSVASTG